ncbi:ArsR/SmtB family transcription factor [Sulfobacillus harzensis]|uniref:Metalloregulator ArsR/SmtB family transcription factor n=1 Tax=Sulfobacillus harzensis TaxID=2729629 RepID=A0A7Y0L689_9FIRM|nr:metalloregulator ArsR/SmtB family transcription factor [Sulfobacillus harzensis]NMP23707.1 metalloregulator ArsR/SmtB family transcription factor [Sulfobacillus harzensis]
MTDDHRRWKDAVYGQFARIGKALGHARRLEILDLLSQGPKNVETLANELAASSAAVSRHLQILFEAHLVTFEKQGTYVIYQLARDAVADLVHQIQAVSEDVLADVRELHRLYLTQHDALEPVGHEELKDLIAAGTVYLIDVRPPAEYAEGHLPGAISVPLPDVADHFAAWHDDRPIVAYCRGRYCLYARDAVRILQQHGVAARRSEVTVWNWGGPQPIA